MLSFSFVPEPSEGQKSELVFHPPLFQYKMTFMFLVEKAVYKLTEIESHDRMFRLLQYCSIYFQIL